MAGGRSGRSGAAAAGIAGAVLAMTLGAAPAMAQRVADNEVRKMIVNDFLAGFRPGDCPCPYSYGWNGEQCADKSQYSRRTSQYLYCYPQDVPWREIRDYRRRLDLPR